MKRFALAIVTAASVVLIPAAWSFQRGEHVTVGSTNQTGTVVEDTGKLVKVHIDASGYSADVGLWFDKEQDMVTSGVGGAKMPPASGGNDGARGNGGNNSSGTNSSQSGLHVRVGSTGQTGTVLEDKGTMVKIHIDNSGYPADVGVWFTKEQLTDTVGAGNATVPKQTPPNNLSNPGSSLRAEQRKPGGAGNTGNQNLVNNAENADKGVGAPPDGLYTCNKISGRSYIHIGTIEIRGGTYKGFSSQQGSFHPFTIDGSGSIVWTAGLTGLPAGWTLKPGKYVGLDYRGRPLIRVYYNSDRGAAEVVDATKEK